jgi:hypothetical protein
MAKYEKKDYDHYGLAVYESTDGGEYAVGTEAQSQKAAAAYIRDSLWAFKSDFLEDYVPKGVTADVLGLIQEKCESGNDALAELVGKRLKKLTEDAIKADGRGHFLSSYNGEEMDSEDIEGLPPGKLAFRIQ